MSDEQRRHQPGRRRDDLIAYEVMDAVRELLKADYLSKTEAQRDYIPRQEHRLNRDWTLRLLLAVLAAGQIIEAVIAAHR